MPASAHQEAWPLLSLSRRTIVPAVPSTSVPRKVLLALSVRAFCSFGAAPAPTLWTANLESANVSEPGRAGPPHHKRQSQPASFDLLLTALCLSRTSRLCSGSHPPNLLIISPSLPLSYFFSSPLPSFPPNSPSFPSTTTNINVSRLGPSQSHTHKTTNTNTLSTHLLPLCALFFLLFSPSHITCLMPVC